MKSANKTRAPAATTGQPVVTAQLGNSADLQLLSKLPPLRRGKSASSKSATKTPSLYHKNTKRKPEVCDRLYDRDLNRMAVFEHAGVDFGAVNDFPEDVLTWVSTSVFETTRNQGLSEEEHSLDHLELGLLAY